MCFKAEAARIDGVPRRRLDYRTRLENGDGADSDVLSAVIGMSSRAVSLQKAAAQAIPVTIYFILHLLP